MSITSTFSRAVRSLLALWFTLLALAAWVKIGVISLLVLSLTGAMPFALVVLWLGLSEYGKKIRDWFDAWHLRAFSVAALFVYGIYGRKWAGDIINELFNVDARYFGLTSAVLTVLFTPFGVLYRTDVVGPAFNLFILAAALIIPLYLTYLITAEGVDGRGKKVGYLVLTVVGASAALALAYNIAKTFKPAVKAFAVWADFNDNHLCTDSWASEVKGIVFLDDGRVLGYFPNASDHQFKVVSCNYAKEF
jgi:hypothetical protein